MDTHSISTVINSRTSGNHRYYTTLVGQGTMQDGQMKDCNALSDICIREALVSDLPRMLEIYNHVVRTSAATFDLEDQTMEQRSTWFLEHDKNYPLIVGELGGIVVGYCSLSHFRDKPGYAKTVESSIYVDKRFQGLGIGKKLVTEILRRAHVLGYHVVIAGIAGGNDASVHLHESLGFEYVGCFKEVGHKFGKWQDVLFYQLQLRDTGLVDSRKESD